MIVFIKQIFCSILETGAMLWRRTFIASGRLMNIMCNGFNDFRLDTLSLLSWKCKPLEVEMGPQK